MEHSYILSILYEMALIIGGEVSVKPLLNKVLQRLLYHTSFPAGFVCLELPSATADSTGLLDVRIDAAVGDYELAGLVGQTVRLPAQLLLGAAARGEDAAMLAALPDKGTRYTAFLRLPIEGQGVIVLLAPQMPDSELPLTQLFQPLMASLAKAIVLCRNYDAYTGGLIAARDASQQALTASEDRFGAISAAATDGLIMIDDSDAIVSWNPAAERILGYRADEVLGNPLHRTLAPERYRGLAAQGLSVFRATGTGAVLGKVIEMEALHKDGHEFPVELSISPLQLNGRWHAVGLLRDITEKRRMAEELHQASVYNRSLIEASLDPLVTISAEGKVTDVNQATEKATGRSRAELIGTDFSDYFTEPDKAREGYQHVFAKGYVTDYPLALRHREGHVTEVLYNASVYRDEAGQVLGVFAAARDVTERNRAEQEVRQLSLQNRLILDSAGEGIYGLDSNGRCTFANPAALQFLGFKVEELLGQHIHSLIHHTRPDGSPYPEEECPVQAAYKQGVVHRGNDLYWRKAGNSFPAEFISTPILEGEKITGAVVAFRDITERKLDEEALRRLNRELRAISNCNQTLMRAEDEQTLLDDICRIICDDAGYRMAWVGYPENDEEKSIRLVSRAGVDSGYLEQAKLTWADTDRGHGPSGSAIRSGKSVSIQDFDTDPEAAPWRDAALQRGYRSSISLPLKDESANTFGILNIYAAMPNAFTAGEIRLLEELAGDMAFGIMVLRARIERLQAEAEVKALNLELEQRVAARTADLEAANKELEAFSYSVSHDLRTPLRAIDGFSHMLLEDYADKLDDEGKRLLNVVRDNASRMGQLIDDILKFSRAGRLEVNYSEIDMEKMANSVLAELQPSVADGKVQFEIEHIPPARGDSAMMHQVFVNLLSNAIKFSRNSTPAKIRVGCSIEGDEAIYFVQDNGAGFDMQYADKLFGVFQRLHSTTEFEGTGIGLAIVKRIVTRHGGRVWAEGKINEGATIYFALPRGDRPSE